MKSAGKREYRQTARAEAAEATAQRILVSFERRARTQWFDEITLDTVATDAGVTVQTVIRRFGGKEGLLDALFERVSAEVTARRVPDRSGLDALIDVVVEDYEQNGEFALHFLLQEARWPAVRALCDRGRAAHRLWVSEAFAPWLDASVATRRSSIDGLVVATDVYTWKLLRRDMQRSVNATKQIMLRFARSAIEGNRGR